MSKTILNVGDVLYCSYYDKITEVAKIERVTATQAISKKYRFRREQNGILFKEMGAGRWSSSYWEIETPELKEQLKVQQLRYKLTKKIESLGKKVSEMELSELERALELLNQISPDQP